jgi:predicted TIM-barrel fold metal-dependent hydrolase
MITDSNSHLGSIYDAEALAHFQQTGDILPRVIDRYFEVMGDIKRSIVVAFPQGPHINDNESIARFALQFQDRIAPFYLIDPHASDCLEMIDRACQEWNAKGFHLAPIYQKFRPDEEQWFPIYEKLQTKGMPLIWFQGSSFEAVDGPLEWANPVLLDKVARSFPELRMIIAHMGSPFFRETVALIKKHKHVYTEMSALWHRSWDLYGALVSAYQYGALGKVFFGSEFPMQTPQQSKDVLAAVASMAEGTNFPSIPKEEIEALLHRDSFELLGISM